VTARFGWRRWMLAPFLVLVLALASVAVVQTVRAHRLLNDREQLVRERWRVCNAVRSRVFSALRIYQREGPTPKFAPLGTDGGYLIAAAASYCLKLDEPMLGETLGIGTWYVPGGAVKESAYSQMLEALERLDRELSAWLNRPENQK
jgi:transposase